MRSKRTLWVVATATTALITTVSVGVGAAVAGKQGAAPLAELVRDPLAIFGQRSPGGRRPGALYQTKHRTLGPQTPAPPLRNAPPPRVELAPPWTDARTDVSCERLTAAPATRPTRLSPEIDRLASQLVTAVQQSLAARPASAPIERADAVEQAIESVLEANNATPEIAGPALDVVHARLVALGVSCTPGVPQAMKVASVAVVEVIKPTDVRPGAISPPNPVLIGVPPLTGGGGGGGGVTHPAAR